MREVEADVGVGEKRDAGEQPDRDQEVGDEGQRELGEDRVERVHHQVGEQPAVRG